MTGRASHLPNRDERFFASTRGRVVSLLRGSSRTVDELAAELGLTDNAIRGHLAHLERDGLIRHGELRRRGGKPAYTYELTPEADRLFPRAYGLLLNQLLRVLAERLSAGEIAAVLDEVGHRLPVGPPAQGDLGARVEHAAAVLTRLGGDAEVEAVEGGYLIRGCACPLAAAVDATPVACLMAEALLSDIVGSPVRQTCEHDPIPQCRFVVGAGS
jgi:predicted ArsR family transcriptional regulator